MCSNQNGLTCYEVGLDVRLPVGKHTAQNVLQALGAGRSQHPRSGGRAPASRGRYHPAGGGGTS